MHFDLPALPEGWKYRTLASCCQPESITYGIVQPGAPTESGVPIVRVNNFRNTRLDLTEVMHVSPDVEAKYSRTRLKGGEVLVTIVGSVGQVAIAPASIAGFNVARAVAVIEPLPDTTSEWIALCLRSPLSQYLLSSRANTTVQTTINLKDLRALPIPIPPDGERDGIATLIGALDSRITLLRETNTTLEAIAQALFKSWFVDFDPVRAKMAGRAPEGMDEATAALFPDNFEDSELGEVPRGWDPGSLGQVAQVARRQVRPEEMDEDLHYVGLEHIPRRCLSLTDWGVAEGLESAKACFGVGDILFGKLRPYFHKVVIAPVAGVCSTDILVCQPRAASYYAFVAMHLFSDALVTYADRLSNGAKMPRVNWKDLADYRVILPPPTVADAFTETVQPLLDRMAANVLLCRTLSSLRDTLLPRLISGQLRLPEATEAVDHALATTP